MFLHATLPNRPFTSRDSFDSCGFVGQGQESLGNTPSSLVSGEPPGGGLHTGPAPQCSVWDEYLSWWIFLGILELRIETGGLPLPPEMWLERVTSAAMWKKVVRGRREGTHAQR